ncbi:hypothetical protein FTUN_7642 [Frigoriglobus tundricola]|uniref:Uncharacterized protein n=1 Tax=Frigoriglobus tundricola TaxID=2774151 RepID=A0A6M5Z110_9BACT|nr:hypothetical protein FTUN_7642 [Frigoriglobus tundricola]
MRLNGAVVWPLPRTASPIVVQKWPWHRPVPGPANHPPACR